MNFQETEAVDSHSISGVNRIPKVATKQLNINRKKHWLLENHGLDTIETSENHRSKTPHFQRVIGQVKMRDFATELEESGPQEN